MNPRDVARAVAASARATAPAAHADTVSTSACSGAVHDQCPGWFVMLTPNDVHACGCWCHHRGRVNGQGFRVALHALEREQAQRALDGMLMRLAASNVEPARTPPMSAMTSGEVRTYGVRQAPAPVAQRHVFDHGPESVCFLCDPTHTPSGALHPSRHRCNDPRPDDNGTCSTCGGGFTTSELLRWSAERDPRAPRADA